MITGRILAGQWVEGKQKQVLGWAPKFDAFAKTMTMAKQKFRPTRLGGFSGTKAYI
jgi:hypothetical protein